MEQDSNPHLLNAKHTLLNVSIKLSRNCRILSFRQVIVPQSKAHFFDDSRRLDVRSMNIHMSRVNFDKQ